ncbi:endospore germination permease [Clostridiaceae bacterium UIB06]|uniref:Endospore germination permease n=1 Tax=Clostridium thailandense TaxID=2794346 RepID=A0A949U3E2_9CLOT|nr:endospore germination permease [Clostridium thailandense]MBV7276730.1 endospore germination permease [Clostridium thailandense]MCH5138035.1 endospore germination permease [Clostridiaceae bacterium UIB06]
MNIEKKNLLTPNEIIYILIGIMLGVSTLSLPNEVTVTAKQDGWISVMIGAAYPLYVSVIAIYISGKFPKDNILELSKKYLGKYIGNILNFFFFLSFFSYLPSISSGVGIVIRTYAVPLLTPLKIYSVLSFAVVYAASKGIKVLGRISAFCFFILLAIILPSVAVLKQGSYLNVSPVFGSGLLNILEATKASAYYYSCIEIIFLIYPFINDSSKIRGSVLKAVGIICTLYTWITFITIYYVGTTVIQKTIWSFFTVIEGVKVEIVNNFRYVFVFFWILIELKSIALFYYACMFILEDILKVRNRELSYVTMSVIIIGITIIYYRDMLDRSRIGQYTSSISTIYNLIYITFIAILVRIKKGG